MGISTTFNGVNKILVAPEGEEENVSDLHVFNNGIATVSAWVFTEEEMLQINKDGCVFISVLAGITSPPVFVGSSKTTKEVIKHTGKVW